MLRCCQGRSLDAVFKVKMIGSSLKPLFEAYLVTGASSWILPGLPVHVASTHHLVSWPPYAPITVSALP